MWTLKLRMYLLLSVLFAIVYAIVTVIGTYMGVSNFYAYIGVALVFMAIQYFIGPKLVEWSMRVRYVERAQNPKLFQMVDDLAMRAQIPVPKIGISQTPLPNAFAFGRGIGDGRVCVTEGILRLLNDEELKAVLAHELSHIKNRDVLTITILSVIPMILYRIAWHFLFFGNRNRDRGSANTVLIGVAAFLFYFITNLLVLYASRIREYFADKGAISLGSQPSVLASALYKLVYGSARMDKDDLKSVEGMKAFFVNDPSRAVSEIKELRELDADKSGTIDPYELDILRRREIKIGFGDKLMELMSTHPNMLKRIKQLSEYKN